MNYNDEQLLNISEYETMAKAYTDALKQKGFMIIQVDNEKNRQLINETFDCLSKIKSCLFKMGGFLNTTRMYSLTDRQIKKLRIIFDHNEPLIHCTIMADKTSCFLEFVGLESLLIKNLITLSQQSSFEYEINNIINARLLTMQQIFNVKI